MKCKARNYCTVLYFVAALSGGDRIKSFHIVCNVFTFFGVFTVLLQEMPSYNDKRRRQSLLLEPRPSLLQRCRSNPQIYYGRGKTSNGVGGGGLTILSSASFQHRRVSGLPNMYSRYLLSSGDAGRRLYDTDSVQSLSVSSASSSGLFFSVTVATVLENRETRISRVDSNTTGEQFQRVGTIFSTGEWRWKVKVKNKVL